MLPPSRSVNAVLFSGAHVDHVSYYCCGVCYIYMVLNEHLMDFSLLNS